MRKTDWKCYFLYDAHFTEDAYCLVKILSQKSRGTYCNWCQRDQKMLTFYITTVCYVTGSILREDDFIGNVCYITYVTFSTFEPCWHKTIVAKWKVLCCKKPITSLQYYDTWYKCTPTMGASKTMVTYVTLLNAVAIFWQLNRKIPKTKAQDTIWIFDLY